MTEPIPLTDEQVDLVLAHHAGHEEPHDVLINIDTGESWGWDRLAAYVEQKRKRLADAEAVWAEHVTEHGPECLLCQKIAIYRKKHQPDVGVSEEAELAARETP